MLKLKKFASNYFETNLELQISRQEEVNLPQSTIC